MKTVLFLAIKSKQTSREADSCYGHITLLLVNSKIYVRSTAENRNPFITYNNTNTV